VCSEISTVNAKAQERVPGFLLLISQQTTEAQCLNKQLNLLSVIALYQAALQGQSLLKPVAKHKGARILARRHRTLTMLRGQQSFSSSTAEE
jgi:hypothetical protein